jgi:hypothetical protein
MRRDRAEGAIMRNLNRKLKKWMGKEKQNIEDTVNMWERTRPR